MSITPVVLRFASMPFNTFPVDPEHIKIDILKYVIQIPIEMISTREVFDPV